MRKIILLTASIIAIVLMMSCVLRSSKSPPEKLTIGPHFTVYGTLTNFQQEGDLVKFFINQDIYNCEKNISSLIFSSTIHTSSLQANEFIKGKKYFFDFHKINESYDWRLYIDSNTLDAIDLISNRCAKQHDSDLVIDQKTETFKKNLDKSEPEQIEENRIIPINISINNPMIIGVDLINRQNTAIKYRIADMSLVDERVAQPFLNWWIEPKYEERLKNAKIGNCRIDYDREEQTSQANSKQPLTFTITCSEPVNCKKYSEGCDIEGKNCRKIDWDYCSLYLWGQIFYTDELGFEHTIPDKGIVKQEITS